MIARCQFYSASITKSSSSANAWIEHSAMRNSCNILPSWLPTRFKILQGSGRSLQYLIEAYFEEKSHRKIQWFKFYFFWESSLWVPIVVMDIHCWDQARTRIVFRTSLTWDHHLKSLKGQLQMYISILFQFQNNLTPAKITKIKDLCFILSKCNSVFDISSSRIIKCIFKH